MFKVRFFQVCPAVASIVVRLRRASRPEMRQFLFDWDIPRILVTFAIVAYINFYLIFGPVLGTQKRPDSRPKCVVTILQTQSN